MILQELKKYYDRKAADAESEIAPEGWEWKEISFVIVIDENGSFLRFEDTREGKGNKKRGKKFLVPMGIKKAAPVVANLLWDTSNYVLGILSTENLDEKEKERKLSRLPAQMDAFFARVKNELPDTARKNAILTFLSSIDLSLLKKSPLWDEVYSSKSNMTFRFDGENQLYCSTDEVKQHISGKVNANANCGLCLITGEKDTVSRLHSPIKGVWGAQVAGANIVSFNLDAFRSFGKKQGANAPIGDGAMFAYTTALNSLLDRDSLQRVQIGDASTVFWSDSQTQFEEDFSFFFDPPKDDPDAGTRKIKTLLDSPKTGGYLDDTGTEGFFVLGLSPNASRLSVRYWWKGTVGEIAHNIRKHFQDLEIVKPSGESEYYSIYRLLVNIATQDDSKNVPPNIAGDFMRSIIAGIPYPASLLQAALRRIKSDAKYRVKPVRAALIKAYLNRVLSTNTNYNEKEKLQVGLDTAQPSIGYQIGRLFAVLEKIQEEANPGLNATIRERYYAAACATPVSVFPTLMRLKNHHLKNLNKGRTTNLEILVSEVVGHFDEFPPHLNLHEQGKFAIGYYHQRQDLFTSKKDAPITDAEN